MASSRSFYFVSLLDILKQPRATNDLATKDLATVAWQEDEKTPESEKEPRKSPQIEQANVSEQEKVWQRLADVIQTARSSLPPDKLLVFDAILSPTTRNTSPPSSILGTCIHPTVATTKPSWGLRVPKRVVTGTTVATTSAPDAVSPVDNFKASLPELSPSSTPTSESVDTSIPAAWDSLSSIFDSDSTNSNPLATTASSTVSHTQLPVVYSTKEFLDYLKDAFEPPGGFDVANDLNLLRYEPPCSASCVTDEPVVAPLSEECLLPQHIISENTVIAPITGPQVLQTKKNSSQDLQKAPLEEQIPLARQCLSLPRSYTSDQSTKITPEFLKDAVLVCIDFENGPAIVENPKLTKLYAQMGVCILDTRLLSSWSDSTLLEDYLQTRNFSTRNNQKWRDQLFIFGKTERTTIKDLHTKLDELLDTTRNNILIGHDVEHEIAVINALGFDIAARFEVVLDTQEMMRCLFLPDEYKLVRHPPRNILDLRLEGLLSRIGVEFADLHVGGNDANFTLKAFLLLVVESLTGDRDEQGKKGVNERRRIRLLKEIGMMKLPPRIPQNTAAQAGSPGLSLGVVRTSCKSANAGSKAKVCYRPVMPSHGWGKQAETKSREPRVMLNIPSPFEPRRTCNLEHEEQLKCGSELDWARNEAMAQIGFGEVMYTSPAWWRSKEGEEPAAQVRDSLFREWTMGRESRREAGRLHSQVW